MSTAEKLTFIAENIPKVYKAGQSSMVDETKIIKKTVSGESVMLDDVSEIPHDVEVKLSSGGKNLAKDTFTGNLFVASSVGSAFYETSSFSQIIGVLPNTIYTLSGDVSLMNSGLVRIGFSSEYPAVGVVTVGERFTKETPFTFTTPEDCNYIVLMTGDSNVNEYPNLMLNEGSEGLPYKETLTDYSGVSLTRCGGNLCDPIFTGNLFVDTDAGSVIRAISGYSQVIPCSPNTTYTISGDTTGMNADDVRIGFTNEYPEVGVTTIGKRLNTTGDIPVLTFTTPDKCRYILLMTGDSNVNEYPNLMVNIGTTPLPYEPYNGQIITANADGTVEGVKSTSPNMYLTTDNQNVTINATYHRSYGIQTEYDRFWDSFQDYGNRQNYSYGFAGYGWTNDTFKPKYSLSDAIINDHLYMFNNSRISEIDYDLNVSYNPSVSYLFAGNINLKKVKSVMLHASATGGDSCFRGSIALEDVTFKNAIPCAFDFHWSTKLSKATILNIFEHLSSTVTGQTLTLSKTAVTNAFGSTTATEWTNLVATKTNWTISLV